MVEAQVTNLDIVWLVIVILMAYSAVLQTWLFLGNRRERRLRNEGAAIQAVYGERIRQVETEHPETFQTDHLVVIDGEDGTLTVTEV